MLSTMLPFFATVCALLALFFSFAAVRFAWRMRYESASASRFAKQDAEIAELTDSVASLSTTMKKLAGRQAMRDHRSRKSNGSDIPDPRDDPAGYKREMRLRHGIGAAAK